ncbi:MAG: hypothetical protein GY946_19215 [bacterium]|nr:hypothetical protein [bacterium]
MITVVVIALIMVALGAQLGGGFGVHLRNSSRSLAAELEYVGQRAIATGRTHRFVVDLESQAYRTEVMNAPKDDEAGELPEHADLLDLSVKLSNEQFEPVNTSDGDWRWLNDSEVVFDEVRIGEEEVREGLAAIGFAPDGGADPAEIWLVDDGGYSMQLRVLAFTGEIRLEENPE